MARRRKGREKEKYWNPLDLAKAKGNSSHPRLSSYMEH